jgi:hypothetical protein
MNAEVVLSRRVRRAAISLLLSLLLAFAVVPMFGSAAIAQVGCSYNVAASVVGGHGSVSPTRQKVGWRKTATIYINPDTGFHIGQIVDNRKSMPIANPYKIPTVHDKHDVYVIFNTNQYTVGASVSGGHGTVAPTSQQVAYEGTASIDLTPESGYRVATITDNGATMPVADPYVIHNVTADHSVVVAFTASSFTVNATVHGGNGTVSPPTQSVAAGGTAAVNINPDTGYEIAAITDNDTVKPVANPYLINGVAANHDVVVTFATGQYAVTAAAPGGNGTVSPASQTVAYGGTASIDITPGAGYHTATITDNGTSMPVSDPYVINSVAAAHSVVVTFAINQYTVAASVDGGNGTALPATQPVTHGGTASIAITEDPGFHLATITDNGVSMLLSSPYVINNVAADHNVVVTFTNTNYMVSALVIGGHGSVAPASQLVAFDTDASINIFPDPGFHIQSIMDNGSSMPPASTYWIYGVIQNHSVVVSFEADSFTVNATSEGPGGTVDPASQGVVSGGTAAINIHPATGYHIAFIFDGILPQTVSNPFVITNVTANHDVTVVFDTDEFDVNATVAGGHGTVSPSTQKAQYGQTATVDITPEAGYHAAAIVDNGAPATPSDPYVIDNVTEAHNVVVSFAQNEYSVDASVDGGHGTVSPTTQTAAGGGTAAIAITPATGYHIERIADNGEFETITDPYIITNCAADHEVVVTLAVNEYEAKATVTGGNGVVDPHQQSVTYGDTALIGLYPDSSYHPAIIVDNGKRMPVSNPYFIEDTKTNHTVSVVFEYDDIPTYYLAEGSTAHGFSTYISIENPNAEALNARLTYMLSNGSTKQQTIGLPGMSQMSVNPAGVLGAADFSTEVTCVQGKTIAVDRTMMWTGPGAPSPEAHNSVGVTSPETTWYLPEGCSGYGFETWTLVENPNNESTDISLVYMIEGVGPKQINRVVPAHARATYSMLADIGQQNASVEVGSSLPVVAERSMYRNNRREGSDSIGATEPATTFYLAEGSTAWGFTTYVLVQNPNTTSANVTFTCMTASGPKTLAPFKMAPGTRQTVLMNSLIPDTDFSTKVSSDVPVIAERAMYWGAGTPLGEACHDSIGLDAPHTMFFLPDGQTSGGCETYTLVQNPNDVDVKVQIGYLLSDGTSSGSFIVTVPANSRATYNMGAQLPSGRAGIVVACVTPGQKVLAERSMYWNNRGAGTDTVGNWAH